MTQGGPGEVKGIAHNLAQFSSGLKGFKTTRLRLFMQLPICKCYLHTDERGKNKNQAGSQSPVHVLFCFIFELSSNGAAEMSFIGLLFFLSQR